MVLVNSAEFAAQQQKYFNLALNQQVFIKDGQHTFVFTKAPEKKLLKPDADFYRALSAEEFREKLVVVLDKVDKKYANQCK